MEVKSVKLVCFSPTGATKKIVKAVGEGIGDTNVEMIDITKKEVRNKKSAFCADDLIVVGAPIYMGRVPEVMSEWFDKMLANKTPAVCIAVYGNRAYDDALLELKDILSSKGCVPIAGAGYIGEHSFSSVDTPIAQGRPDLDDLNKANKFGESIAKTLKSIGDVDQIDDLALPGNYPYGGSKMWDVDFIGINDRCDNCGACIKVCPVDAIDVNDTSKIDVEQCITCCACIKACPQNAKFIKQSKVMDASIKLNKLFGEQKEPDYYL